MRIRPATCEDLRQIAPIYEQLYTDSAALQPDFWKTAAPDLPFLERVIGGAVADLLVAEKDSVILGFALVQEQSTPGFAPVIHHRFASLVDLCVDRAHRSRGIGAALIGAVKDWARARELDYVELNVLQENLRAAKLYETEGFQDAMRTMRCTL